MNEHRLCKIVWNSEGWVKPIVRNWSHRHSQNRNVGYEQKHGFVHEDWLFNPRYFISGYQYGYIKGAGGIKKSIRSIETIYLFTINPYSKERLYIGKLNDVDRLQGPIADNVKKRFKSFEKEVITELKSVGADYKALNKDNFMPNVRFRLSNIDIYETPIIITDNWFSKYTRTTANIMNADLYQLFANIENELKFRFVASNPNKKTREYFRQIKPGGSYVNKVHNHIEKALYQYLILQKVNEKDIACDTTSFGGKLADVVVRLKPNLYDIYEIKTGTDFRKGLREAIGQLLDYATWEKGISVRKIVAVLPYYEASEQIKSVVSRLKNKIGIGFQVILYNEGTGRFIELEN